MNTPQRPTCSTCPYWDKVAFAHDAGNCRRYATVQPDNRRSKDWCGEHPKFPEYLAQLEVAEGGKP